MRNIVAFDIETTGLDKKKDYIIQISMIKFNPETYEIIDTYDSYVKPLGSYVMSYPAYIKHKVKPEFLYDKPTIKDIAKDIVNFFEDCDVLSFNGNNFDIPFLNKELSMVGEHIDFTSKACYDSCLIERQRNPNTLEGTFKRYTGQTMEEFGLTAHNSLSDIKATIEVFKNQMSAEPVQPEKLYGDSGMVRDMNFEGKLLPCFAVGKYRSLPVSFVAKIDEGYIKWAISNKCDIDKETKQMLEQYINE